MPRCAACGEENPDRFRFCGACGNPLYAEEFVRLLRDKRRIVGLLKAGEDQPLAPGPGFAGADFVVRDVLAREGLVG